MGYVSIPEAPVGAGQVAVVLDLTRSELQTTVDRLKAAVAAFQASRCSPLPDVDIKLIYAVQVGLTRLCDLPASRLQQDGHSDGHPGGHAFEPSTSMQELYRWCLMLRHPCWIIREHSHAALTTCHAPAAASARRSRQHRLCLPRHKGAAISPANSI